MIVRHLRPRPRWDWGKDVERCQPGPNLKVPFRHLPDVTEENSGKTSVRIAGNVIRSLRGYRLVNGGCLIDKSGILLHETRNGIFLHS